MEQDEYPRRSSWHSNVPGFELVNVNVARSLLLIEGGLPVIVVFGAAPAGEIKKKLIIEKDLNSYN